MASESPLDAGDPFVSPAQAITCGSPLFYADFRRKGGGMSACVRGGRALVRRVGTRAEEFPNDRDPHIFRFPQVGYGGMWWDIMGYSARYTQSHATTNAVRRSISIAPGWSRRRLPGDQGIPLIHRTPAGFNIEHLRRSSLGVFTIPRRCRGLLIFKP